MIKEPWFGEKSYIQHTQTDIRSPERCFFVVTRVAARAANVALWKPCRSLTLAGLATLPLRVWRLRFSRYTGRWGLWWGWRLVLVVCLRWKNRGTQVSTLVSVFWVRSVCQLDVNIKSRIEIKYLAYGCEVEMTEKKCQFIAKHKMKWWNEVKA